MATRYVSTRTAVRAARVLRAICVFQRIFVDAERPLSVQYEDLASLRLFLVLAGPSPEGVTALLTRESDPRERRQLEIVRTEREIFDRCFSKLPRIADAPRPPKVDVDALQRAMSSAVDTQDPQKVSDAAKRLADAAGKGGEAAQRAIEALAVTIRTLTENAVRAGMTAGTDPTVTIDQSVSDLASIALAMERAAVTTRPAARWVRGRALSIIEEAAALLPGTPTDLGALIGRSKNESATYAACLRRLYEVVAGTLCQTR